MGKNNKIIKHDQLPENITSLEEFLDIFGTLIALATTKI